MKRFLVVILGVIVVGLWTVGAKAQTYHYRYHDWGYYDYGWWGCCKKYGHGGKWRFDYRDWADIAHEVGKVIIFVIRGRNKSQIVIEKPDGTKIMIPQNSGILEDWGRDRYDLQYHYRFRDPAINNTW